MHVPPLRQTAGGHAMAVAWAVAILVWVKSGVWAWAILSIGTILQFVYNLWESVRHTNPVSLIGVAVGAGALILNGWAQWCRVRERFLERQNAELKQQNVILVDLRRHDEVIIDGLRSDIRHAFDKLEQANDKIDEANAERAGMQVMIAQLSAEYLRQHGDLKHSGSRYSLKQFSMPPDETDILLADDDETTRRAMGRLLRFYGFRVIEARSASETIAGIQGRRKLGSPFDFIVTDYRFSGEDETGLDIVLEARRPTQVIVMSGVMDDGIMVELKQAGAAAVLVKPVDKGELLALMGLKEEIDAA